MKVCKENKLHTESPFGFSDLVKTYLMLYCRFLQLSECAFI